MGETFFGNALPSGLETKFTGFSTGLVAEDAAIEGYASLFGQRDGGGDRVVPGAYGAALARLSSAGRSVKMLWQHDPTQPIGVWESVIEDERGLYVRGRLLTDVQRGAEAAALIRAGAIDGLSIGYRTVRAEREAGGRKLLELDLWEVSLVTFPMLPDARLAADEARLAGEMLAALTEALTEDRAKTGRSGS